MRFHGETSKPGTPEEKSPPEKIEGDEIDPNIVNEFSRLESPTNPSDLQISSGPELHSGIVRPLDASVTVGSLPKINGPQDVNPKAYGSPKDPIKFKLTVLLSTTGLKLSKNEFEIFDKSTISMGRRLDRDIVLGSDQVSRNHCSIVRNGDKISIHDAGSSNGTFVNDVKIAPSAELKSGDIIRLSSSVSLKFEKI